MRNLPRRAKKKTDTSDHATATRTTHSVVSHSLTHHTHHALRQCLTSFSSFIHSFASFDSVAFISFMTDSVSEWYIHWSLFIVAICIFISVSFQVVQRSNFISNFISISFHCHSFHFIFISFRFHGHWSFHFISFAFHFWFFLTSFMFFLSLT